VHMFGVLHCCYYRCLMNGSSSIEEVDSQPPYLCGMCLKKLQSVLGFDPLDRYSRLAVAWAQAERDDISRWYASRVAIVQSSLAGYRGMPKSMVAWHPGRGADAVRGDLAPRLQTAQRARRPGSNVGRASMPGEAAPAPDEVPLPTVITDFLEEEIALSFKPRTPRPDALRRTCTRPNSRGKKEEWNSATQSPSTQPAAIPVYKPVKADSAAHKLAVLVKQAPEGRPGMPSWDASPLGKPKPKYTCLPSARSGL